MNVQFSRSIGGFNREEVIEYIRKLTNEKSRAENSALESSNKLDDAEYCIETMKSEFEEERNIFSEKISALEADIADKDALISELRSEIEELTNKLNSINEEKRNTLTPALSKASAAEEKLRTLAAELAEISDRVKTAHADISDAVVTIEDYTKE